MAIELRKADEKLEKQKLGFEHVIAVWGGGQTRTTEQLGQFISGYVSAVRQLLGPDSEDLREAIENWFVTHRIENGKVVKFQ